METSATATSPRREIIYKGQLQQKVCKKFGTLLRKKRHLYEDELWVVLCVHDGGTGEGGIPHLEWYGEPQSIVEHRPLKVQDLLDCQYVNVTIGEERCMVIGFIDKSRPVLELSAPSIEERKQWIDTLTRTLRQLNCIVEFGEEDENGGGPSGPRAENEYIGFGGRDEIEDQRRDYPHRAGVTALFPTNSDAEEMSPHVPLSPIPSQMQGMTLDGGGGTPKSARRVLGLRDPIPMSPSPSTSQLTRVVPSGIADHIPQTTETSAEEIRQIPLLTSTSLPASTDLYSTPKPKARQKVPQPTSPITVSDETVEEKEKEEHSNEENGDSDSAPPPLPPRAVKLSLSTSIPTVPTSPIPSSPPQKMSQYDALANQQPSSSRSQYDQLCPSNSNGHSQQYQQVSSRFSSELSDHFSSSKSSRSSSARNSDHRHSQDDPPPPFPHSPPMAHYDVLSPGASSALLPPQSFPLIDSPEHIFRESLNRPRRISFWLALLAEHVAFVELREKVWIAGWNTRADTNLRDILNFGDEVEQMNGVELRSVKQLPEIFANIKPGVQVELTLRSNPCMKVFTLVKPENPKRELGIVLYKGKNKIASVELRSAADRAGVSATMPPYYFHPSGTLRHSVASGDGDDRNIKQVRACITQLNGIPLSPFSHNDQFFRRLDSIPVGTPLNLTLLPADFCSQLATKMKSQLRDWRRFVHDS